MIKPILRSSSRLARRADQQGARSSESNQSEIEKLDTGRNHDFVVKCKNKRCKTCPLLSTSQIAISNVSNKKHSCVYTENSNLSCHSQNLIYLMSCKNCNQQYVGETTTRLSVRMNGHRSSTTGCLHIINHKKTCVGSEFSIQILEKLIGNGYGDDNKPDPEITTLRKTREDYWIKQLRTLYPYGLNEKAFDKFGDSSTIDHAIGRLFPPLKRSGVRPRRTRISNHKPNDINSAKSFFEYVHDCIKTDTMSSYNKIRITLNNLPKLLKRLSKKLIYPVAHCQCNP